MYCCASMHLQKRNNIEICHCSNYLVVTFHLLLMVRRCAVCTSSTEHLRALFWEIDVPFPNVSGEDVHKAICLVEMSVSISYDLKGSGS